MIAVTEVFRAAGYVTRTMDEVFGRRPVDDVEWIIHADNYGMAVVCKDDRIRRRPAEKHALHNSSLQVLCLTNGNLGRAEQAEWYRSSLGHYDGLWRRSGPWVYGVYADRVGRLRLYPPD